MPTFTRHLTLGNIVETIEAYKQAADVVAERVSGLKGLELFRSLKRDEIGTGPYPNVSVFEAANRIMTDMVLLHGTQFLLQERVFPFDSYSIEYGTENAQGFDIVGKQGGLTLVGEAFSVAKSFFSTKKTAMLDKLRDQGASADIRILIFNDDAVSPSYRPQVRTSEYFVMVREIRGGATVYPVPAR